ncbi:MAG: hypothetical protein WD552_02080 [Candidatus Paceibacterota bacterium]
MANFKKCPKCYLDLEVAEKKIEKKIDSWIEGKHKDSLKWPRIRTKIVSVVIGLLVGLAIAFVITLLYANIFELPSPSETEFLDLTVQEFLVVLGGALIILIPPYYLSVLLMKESIPTEEKRLRANMRKEILGIRSK